MKHLRDRPLIKIYFNQWVIIFRSILILQTEENILMIRKLLIKKPLKRYHNIHLLYGHRILLLNKEYQHQVVKRLRYTTNNYFFPQHKHLTKLSLKYFLLIPACIITLISLYCTCCLVNIIKTVSQANTFTIYINL